MLFCILCYAKKELPLWHISLYNLGDMIIGRKEEQLTGIVREASRLMVSDGFEIEQKGGCENIVTSSDVAVQNFLCERLLQLMPVSGFLCEEKDINDTRHEYTWIIDPIDGTANYSRGIDQCAICVGLCSRLTDCHRGRRHNIFRRREQSASYGTYGSDCRQQH